MAYAEKQLVNFSESPFTLVGTGVKARYTPGTQGCTVRRFGVMLEVATSATAAVIQLIKRPTPGSAVGESIVAVMTLDVVSAQGNTYYTNDLDVRLLPGEEIIVNVSVAATGGTSTLAFLEIDPDWEAPGNFKAAMINRTA